MSGRCFALKPVEFHSWCVTANIEMLQRKTHYEFHEKIVVRWWRVEREPELSCRYWIGKKMTEHAFHLIKIIVSSKIGVGSKPIYFWNANFVKLTFGKLGQPNMKEWSKIWCNLKANCYRKCVAINAKRDSLFFSFFFFSN